MKYKKAVEHFIETGKRFILLRRWGDDISSLWVEQYFADVDVEKLTNNKYNCITCYRKVLYFSIFNTETLKTERHEKIGYVMALNTEQHMSSASFLDVDTIIFEEFMERGSYIKNEPSRLEIFYNTIDRKRGEVKLWLVGNSISRVCPYITDWGLDEIFRSLKQGEIATKTIKNEENEVKIAVEYCRSSGGKQMAIGHAKSMIDKGDWQTTPQPHLEKSYNCYKVMYRMVFDYQNFRFIAEYLKDIEEPKKKCWFIYPKYTEIKEKTLVISDKIRNSKWWQRDIYQMTTIKNDKLKRFLYDTFREGNIFYCDDLCRHRF